MAWECPVLDSTKNFVGTTDNAPVVIKWNNTESLRVDSGGVGVARDVTVRGELRLENEQLQNWDDGHVQGTDKDIFSLELKADDGGNSCTIQGWDKFHYDSDHDQGAVPFSLALQPAGGNVGIGTTKPECALHVVGDMKVTGDVLLMGADCAERFDISGETPEPGTVVVIDQGGRLRRSQEAYDKKVAGVVSGAGEYRHAIVLDTHLSNEGRVPVALVGKVYCKVDADYSAVQVGDLLTTSPTLGHAMKAAEPLKAFGAVLGKALAPLSAGRALIPILVALQ